MTHHEPSRSTTAPLAETIMAPPELSGGRVCRQRSETVHPEGPESASPCRGAPRGSGDRSLAPAAPAATDFSC